MINSHITSFLHVEVYETIEQETILGRPNYKIRAHLCIMEVGKHEEALCCLTKYTLCKLTVKTIFTLAC